MIHAHRVGLYADVGDGHRWSLYDDQTGELLHGGIRQQLPEVIECWARSHPGAGKLDVQQDGRELRPMEFAELVLACRKRLDLPLVPRVDGLLERGQKSRRGKKKANPNRGEQ